MPPRIPPPGTPEQRKKAIADAQKNAAAAIAAAAGKKKKAPVKKVAPRTPVADRPKPVLPTGPVTNITRPDVAGQAAAIQDAGNAALMKKAASGDIGIKVAPPKFTDEQMAKAWKNAARYQRKENRQAFAKNLAGRAQDIIPYASNIINAFRKPPRGTFAGNVSYMAAPKTRMDAARADILSGLRAQTASANRSLDENTAAAVNAANYGQFLQQAGRIGEAEANTDTQRIMGAGEANSRIEMYNKQAQQNFYDENANRLIAQQNAQSANLANAADKYVTQQSQEADRQSNLEAVRMYNANDITGVKARLAQYMQKYGIGSPEDIAAISGGMPQGNNPLTGGTGQQTVQPRFVPPTTPQTTPYIGPYGTAKKQKNPWSVAKGGQLRGVRFRKMC